MCGPFQTASELANEILRQLTIGGRQSNIDLESTSHSILWRFKQILSASLRLHSHLSDGLRIQNHLEVAESHKFTLRLLQLFLRW